MVEIFKAYDIRGIYPTQINESIFERIGISISKFSNCKRIVIGNDARESSDSLKESLIKGLNYCGVEVFDLGLSSTPMLYQASCDLDVDMGIIITASHNSKEYNGMKVCWKGAKSIARGTGIEKIHEIFNTTQNIETPVEKKVKLVESYKEEYKDKIIKYCNLNENKRLKVVFDAGNGMGGHVDLEILNSVCDLIPLYTELDGTFPNHEANPSKEENLEDLKLKVLAEKADVGFAFDGDSDRIGVVDNQGRMIHADIMGAYLIDNYIKSNPSENVYSYDLRSSMIINDILSRNSKMGVKTRVGHSFIKEIMIKEKSFFSLELSGHYYFWFDNSFVYDSAIRSALEILNFLSLETKPLSEILEKYLIYHKIEEMNFKVKDSEDIFSRLRTTFSSSKFEEIDGLSILGEDWWANIRSSNTEPLLRLNFEAKNKGSFDKYLNLLTSVIKS